MNNPNNLFSGKFIWHDLAAANTAAALQFYRAGFGWTSTTEITNGGHFIRLYAQGENIGSMYQMNRRERESGVPSHWTPYVGVDDIESTVGKVETAGGRILVRPFEVTGVAKIAIVADNLGSIMGLWERLLYE